MKISKNFVPGDTESSVSMTVQSGVEAMDISGDSGDSEEKKTLVRLCKTGQYLYFDITLQTDL